MEDAALMCQVREGRLEKLAPLFERHSAIDQAIVACVLERFRLYSIGWNLKDEGGQVALDPKDQTKPDQEQGDWVWAAKQP